MGGAEHQLPDDLSTLLSQAWVVLDRPHVHRRDDLPASLEVDHRILGGSLRPREEASKYRSVFEAQGDGRDGVEYLGDIFLWQVAELHERSLHPRAVEVVHVLSLDDRRPIGRPDGTVEDVAV